MASEPRLAALLDDPLTRLEDIPQHPSLRIPPLQDPKPPQTASRPLPLEPNARTDKNAHSGKIKLCGRIKALAEALQIHDAGPGPNTSDTDRKEPPRTGRGSMGGSLKSASQEHINYADSAEELKSAPSSNSSRKRRRIDNGEGLGDFVQLPRPLAKQKAEKYPPFKPMAALNGLNEPPPNAALFPPITPNASQDATVGNILNASTAADAGSSITEKLDEAPKNHKSISSMRAARKKQSSIARKKWTDAETDQLLQGVAMFGVGKWKKILSHPDFTFTARTAVDLKDRFRTCCPEGFRRDSMAESPSAVDPSIERLSTPEEIVRANAAESSTTNMVVDSPSSPSPKRRDRQRRDREDLARLGILAPFANAKRRPKRAFTEEEDVDLLKGYTAYGPQWAAIQRDPDLHLGARRSQDLRDRFRIRYPTIYAQAGYLMRSQDQSKLSTTTTLPSEDELKERVKPFSPNSVVGNAPPPISASLNPPAFAPEHKLLPKAEIEDQKKVPDDYPAPSDNRNVLDHRNGPGSNSILQEDTVALFEDWGDNTLPPLALTWEEMVARPIFDID
ncbi:MAG: hypothetical protein M1830_007722 [Pleopsidium flavum]|nr:MAG: hypothetical protein M1830_007722 [Pleopsidium flavum]